MYRPQAAWTDRHSSLLLTGAAFTALAALAVLLNDPLVWVGDNRFEMFENPGRRLDRMLSIWDSSRGFGTFAAEVWVGNTAPLWALRESGLSVAATQHVWHAFLLTLAGTSAAAFVRCFRPRIGVVHVVTGLVYMFGPFAVGFLLPSNLFQNYATAPLMMVLLYRGIHARSPWRSAAAFALVVLFLGIVDPPGVLYIGLYLMIVAGYAVFVDQTTTVRLVLRWVARALPLTLLVMAGPLVAAALSQELFQQNVRETESPLTLNANSSWSESWRGLGGWLIYFRDQAGAVKPQARVFLTNPSVVAATFVAPALAAAALVFNRSRERILFGVLMLFGLLLMVGQYPISDPSPFGEGVRWLYDAVPPTQVLRSSYKAGSGAMLGMAALVGLAVAAVVDRAPRVVARLDDRFGDVDPRLAVVPVIALTLVFATVTQPFWRTGLYDDTELKAVPAYVYEAYAFVDEQPGDGRVLLLPPTNRAEYRWGSVNDDVIDALLDRPHVVEVPIHLSRPVPSTILTAVDASLRDDSYVPGSIANYATRLGLDFVVIRNDLLWESWDIPRPSWYSSLRTDPSLELVAQFGDVGENTTSFIDTSTEASAEMGLHPMEVYRVVDPGSIVRIVPEGAPLLVAGDGESWPTLTSLGLLDAPSTTVTFTGDQSAAELAAALDAGAPLVVTDSNRRRADLITLAPEQTYTLAADGELDRAPYDLFETEAAETVAAYGDATNIVNVGNADTTGVAQPWFRPAAAIDGDPSTAWLVGLPIAADEGVRIELAREHELGLIEIDLADHPDSRREILGIDVTTSDGAVSAASIDDGIAVADISGRPTTSIEITISLASSPGGGLIGFDEIRIEGLRLEERLVAPADVFAHAGDDPALSEALETASIAYVFQRSIGTGDQPEEQSMHRSFLAVADREVSLLGAVEVQATVDETVLAAILGDPITATTTDRLDGQLRFAGQSAVDGNASTAWAFTADSAAEVDLRFTAVQINTVDIDVRIGSGLAAVQSVAIDDGTEVTTVDITPRACDGQCTQTVTVALPGRTVEQLIATVSPDEQSSSLRTVRVDEIRINGVPNVAVESPPCAVGAVTMNGRPVSTQIEGGRAAILAGETVTLRSCELAQLQPGTNTFDAALGVGMTTALITPQDFAIPLALEDRAARVQVLEQHRTGVDLVVSGVGANPADQRSILAPRLVGIGRRHRSRRPASS